MAALWGRIFPRRRHSMTATPRTFRSTAASWSTSPIPTSAVRNCTTGGSGRSAWPSPELPWSRRSESWVSGRVAVSGRRVDLLDYPGGAGGKAPKTASR
uniref:Uncharacterized protein n=1 Tax=Mycobacterium sp. (strain MCS) TaxID=164756 RepID=A0A5Q5BEH8_MYCSS